MRDRVSRVLVGSVLILGAFYVALSFISDSLWPLLFRTVCR